MAPTVPRRTDQGISETSLPGVRLQGGAPIEAFGGGAAVDRAFETGRQAAREGQEIFMAEKKKADDIAFLDADLKASQLQTRLEISSRKMQGKDAGKAPEFVNEEWQKGTDEIAKTLSSPEQKFQFERASKIRYANLDKTVQFHMADEFKKFDDQTTTAYLATAQDEAALHYHDPERIGLSIYQQTAALTKHAQNNGLPPEWLKLKTSEATSKTHSTVITRMLNNGEDQLAKKYFESNKQSLTGADTTVIEKSLEEGTLRGESQRKTDELMRTQSTWKERMDAAKKIEDPKVRDEVDRRLKTEMQTEKALDAEREENIARQATNIIEKTKNFDAIPPAMVASMPVSVRSSLRSYADNLREGKKPQTDWNEYYNLKTMAAVAETKEKFLRTNLLEYRSTMADAEFKELVNLQTGLRNGDTNAENTLDGYRTDQMIVNDALAEAGVDTSPEAGAAAAKQVNQFRRKVDEQILLRQQQTGKKVTNQEVQEIVDNLVIKGVVPGSGFLGFFQKKKHVFELKDGEQIAIEAGDVPKSERAKIEAALRGKGLPVTEDRILELYNRKVQRMVK